MSKTITIRDDIYKLLVSIKKKDESFSMLFERLIESRRNVKILEELRGSVKFRDKKNLLREIRRKRSGRVY
jgi:predicted CopG family antitoxin